MSVTAVGSIAFDAVTTPFGSRERMLGGSAVHFGLAASFFDEISIVGPVGDDFGDEELAILEARGVQTADIERVEGGRTFFWRGVYGWDLNDRETLDTQLNVFADFEPKLSERSRAADVLFLANIQPDLQRQVRAQCRDARFVALDSMNLWIETARESLVEAISEVDCLMLNDAELRQLTQEPNLIRAARRVRERGPRVVVAKQGEYGAAMVTEEGFFGLPAFPLETVVDPTGAGDSFAGGFVGYIAAHPDDELDHELLRRAMAYGTAIASFNVEEFGTERVARLTSEELADRVAELGRITRFSEKPVTLRGGRISVLPDPDHSVLPDPVPRAWSRGAPVLEPTGRTSPIPRGPGSHEAPFDEASVPRGPVTLPGWRPRLPTPGGEPERDMASAPATLGHVRAHCEPQRDGVGERCASCHVRAGLRPPGSGLRPPGSGLRPPASGLRPPGSGLRPSRWRWRSRSRLLEHLAGPALAPVRGLPPGAPRAACERRFAATPRREATYTPRRKPDPAPGARLAGTTQLHP
jgi:sugar/nucleoside kinase (ribokinase family)